MGVCYDVNMKEQEAKKLIEEAGGSWEDFVSWMFGQTVGLNDDGSTDWYDWDVKRFIGYGCKAKNEPLGHFD